MLASQPTGYALTRRTETLLSVRTTRRLLNARPEGTSASMRPTRARLHGVAAADKDAIDAQLRQRCDAVIVLRHLLPPEGLHVEVHLRDDRWPWPQRVTSASSESTRV